MSTSDAIVGAAGKLVPEIIRGLSRRGVDAVFGDAQERAPVRVCDRAVRRAVAEAALVEADADWLDQLAAGLAATLDDPARVDGLIRASLGELSTEAQERWRSEFLPWRAAPRQGCRAVGTDRRRRTALGRVRRQQAAAALVARLDDPDAVVQRVAVLASSVVEKPGEARERCRLLLDC